MRFASCWRASSSLLSASTLRATAGGEESSILLKVRSPLRFPSHVHVQEFPVGYRRQRFGRLARELRKDSHDERELNLLLRTIELHVVFDLDAWGPIARDELLTACLGH